MRTIYKNIEEVINIPDIFFRFEFYKSLLSKMNRKTDIKKVKLNLKKVDDLNYIKEEEEEGFFIILIDEGYQVCYFDNKEFLFPYSFLYWKTNRELNKDRIYVYEKISEVFYAPEVYRVLDV